MNGLTIVASKGPRQWWLLPFLPPYFMEALGPKTCICFKYTLYLYLFVERERVWWIWHVRTIHYLNRSACICFKYNFYLLSSVWCCPSWNTLCKCTYNIFYKKKWNWHFKFKSYILLLTFYFALMPLGKVLIHLVSPSYG